MKVKSILVSQPQPNESSPYHDLGKRNKIKVDFRSFIQIEGVDARDVRQQKIDFSKFTAVVFTSRNVIDHYFRLAEEMRFQVPDDMKYFCQSEAIAFYLQKYIVFRKRKISVTFIRRIESRSAKILGRNGCRLGKRYFMPYGIQ